MPAVLVVTTFDRAQDAAALLPGRRAYTVDDIEEAAETGPAVLVVFQAMPPNGLDLVEAARRRGVPVLWAYMDATPKGG